MIVGLGGCGSPRQIPKRYVMGYQGRSEFTASYRCNLNAMDDADILQFP